MQGYYVLQNPVPNSYRVLGYFSEMGKKEIEKLVGVQRLTWLVGDDGVIVLTDGKVRFSELLSQIKALAQSK